ncbi:MAG TPA: hypothetical protein ENN31_00235 [Candidatus Vogelbacteria bacterium]|nr:hypothetical protein [Candidatus Vogelbacteria bacterium]
MYKKILFDPKVNGPGKKVFKLSRSKIDLFLKCPRCFYLDRRLGVSQPASYPFTLNSAVDHLLKKEFDIYRQLGRPHPLMEKYNIKAKPFLHKDLETWRHNFTGIQFIFEPANFLVYGAIDDLWVDDNGNLLVVDYKATSKDSEVNLDADWQVAYKNQMEIYQWLLSKNKFKVSSTGYFVYANGLRSPSTFDACLKFDMQIIPYQGDYSWVDKTLLEINKILINDSLPDGAKDCEYCSYRHQAIEKEQSFKKEEDKNSVTLF